MSLVISTLLMVDLKSYLPEVSLFRNLVLIKFLVVSIRGISLSWDKYNRKVDKCMFSY